MAAPDGFHPQRWTKRDLEGLAARLAWPAADPPLRSRRGPGPVARAVLTGLVSAVLVAGAGVVVKAQEALPGDTLYGVKRATERVLLAIPVDNDNLRLQLARRRLAEAEARPAQAEDLLEDAAEVLGPVDPGPGRALLDERIDERIEERRGGSPDRPQPPDDGSQPSVGPPPQGPGESSETHTQEPGNGSRPEAPRDAPPSGHGRERGDTSGQDVRDSHEPRPEPPGASRRVEN